MAKIQKLLEKARQNPAGLSFKNFESLLSKCGWIMRRQKGSHKLWYSPNGVRLPIQPTKDGMAHEYQVKQFLNNIS